MSAPFEPAGEFEKGDVSVLLPQAAGGDSAALDALVTRIQGELRDMAARHMGAERVDHTWGPTALVNEALLKLLGPKQLAAISNRRMLFAAAARAMRQTLIDHARARKAARRGGGWRRTTIDDAIDRLQQQDIEIDDLHEAIESLTHENARTMQIVELRFFGGFTVAEIANLFALSQSTVEKELAHGRKLLREWLTT